MHFILEENTRFTAIKIQNSREKMPPIALVIFIWQDKLFGIFSNFQKKVILTATLFQNKF